MTAARDRILLSFDGFELSDADAEALARRAAGITLYLTGTRHFFH